MSSIRNQILLANKSENEYITYTRCLFAFTETVKIASLLERGETLENIHDLVLQKDLLQIRSLASRKSSLRIILKGSVYYQNDIFNSLRLIILICNV